MAQPDRKPNLPNKPNSNFILIIAATLIFFVVFLFVSQSPSKKEEISYSKFLVYVDGVKKISYKNGTFEGSLLKETDKEYIFLKINEERKNDPGKSVEKIVIPKELINLKNFKTIKKVVKVEFKNPMKIVGKYKEFEREKEFKTYLPFPDEALLRKLEINGVLIESAARESENSFVNTLLNLLPWIILLGVFWLFFLRRVQSSNNRAFTFVKSKAKLYKGSGKKTTFDDVAGVEEAKEELKEVVDFLKEPQKYLKMGARIPKGVLLVGPPGTGKTLLAKSVAGEANRPFYSISGSEFVEMFVGVGASRVRDLFDNAKKDAPCILFIDELDAVGRQRGAGLGGGNDEREQTLNQILVEMDGFENKETIIVIAATNRPDILDPALLRPGRFDRQIVVDRPDIRGREMILQIHTKSKPLVESIDLKKLAKGTPGFSGADLENMVNEATLIAARKGKTMIDQDDFEDARDKIIMGPERRSRVMSEDEKTNTAYHEAGHAIVSHFLPVSDPLHKITVIPRGRALGVTQHLPEKDHYSYSKNKLLTEISILMGGRVAEEYKFGKDNVSTGASNDIQRATSLARSIVCKWGMSEKMGPLTYGKDDSPIFIGKEMGRYKDYSEETAREIDLEVKKIISDQYNVARNILEKEKIKLETLVKELLEKETLHSDEILNILGPKPSNEKKGK